MEASTTQAERGRPVILVVEDDENVRRLVAAYLESEGYGVLEAADGWVGLAEAERALPDLVVADIMLPGLDGLQLATKLRASREVPILMLTSRSEEQDILAGFEVGADDYLIKPFSPKVLVARVRAIMHRAGLARDPDETRFTSGDLTLDVRCREVVLAGREVELTTSEFELLRVLVEHPGWVYTREDLLEAISGYSWLGDSRAIDVHVGNLRKKIEDDPADPRRIRTVRGVGYKFQV